MRFLFKNPITQNEKKRYNKYNDYAQFAAAGQGFGCFADCVFILKVEGKIMFAVNDIVMYKQSGICKILDICEKKFGKETRQYYVLCPQDDPNTTIYCPIDAPSGKMRCLLTKDEVVPFIVGRLDKKI